MKILSFDTSNNLASVALIDNSEILSYNITKQSSQQAEKLFQLIDLSLKTANLKLSDLDLVSITNGPGSFTGVRIALAAASGLKIGSKNEFIALTNFQVLAWKARDLYPNKPIAVILDARRDQVYLQIFNQQLEEITQPILVEVSQVHEYLSKDMICIGDGIKLISEEFDHNLNILANAEILAKASEFYWRNALYNALIPLYIRQPDVNQK